MGKKNNNKTKAKNKVLILTVVAPIVVAIIELITKKIEQPSFDNSPIYIDNSIDVSQVINNYIYNNHFSEVNNDENLDNEKNDNIIISETGYKRYLENLIEDDIVFSYYNDYDGDGLCEMFALVGSKGDSESTEPSSDEDEDDMMKFQADNLYGKIWFVSKDGAMEIESDEIEYWSSPKSFLIGGHSFIAFEEYATTGSRTFIWGVQDGRPYQPNISGKVYGMNVNEYDELEGISSTYDASILKTDTFMCGHTWKKYYFYFDGNNFREYGGITINVDDLLRIPDTKKIVDELDSNLYKIDSIYYRDNGIININISKENENTIDYANITLRYDGNTFDIIPSNYGDYHNLGIYEKAFIPAIATYPDKFPY